MSQGIYGQDLPPPGGYEQIRYKRNLPVRGPGGAIVFSSIFAICAWGFYRVGQGNLEKRWAWPSAGSQPAPASMLIPVCCAVLRRSWGSSCRELQREKAWSRIHLVPLIMAEGDRDVYRRSQAALEREKEIMKDVDGQCMPAAAAAICWREIHGDTPLTQTCFPPLTGWEAGKSSYNTKRYTPSTIVVI